VQPDYDCVIAGAGLVGAAQAQALAGLGLKVAIVDPREPLTGATASDVRGLALAPSSRAVLEGLGVWSELSPRINPIRTIHVSDAGSFGLTHLHADDVGFDALGYVCPADILAAALEQKLGGCAAVLWRTTIDDIVVHPDGAVVYAHDADTAMTFSTRLVVGADGTASRVRECAAIGVKTRDYRQSAIVANLTIGAIDRATAYERFTPTGPLALLPLASGRHVAVRCCRDGDLEALLALDDPSYLDELKAGFGLRFGEFTALGRRVHYPLGLSSAERIAAPRIALVGAAANSIHPNGAQGLNLGLRDVAELTAMVKHAQDAGEDVGGSTCLDAYSHSRRRDQRAVIRFTDMLAQLFSSSLPLLPGLRGAAMIALDLNPIAKRALIRRASGLVREMPPLTGFMHA